MTPQLQIKFDETLLAKILREGGVSAWNQLVADLYDRNLINTCWSSEEPPPPLAIDLDFSHGDFFDQNLDGVDFSRCTLKGASFDMASLRGSKFGYCVGASFREAVLDACDFTDAELDGCDFTDATGLENAVFNRVIYDVSTPPIGLPPEVSARCTAALLPKYTEPAGIPETENHDYYTSWRMSNQASVWFLHLGEDVHVDT
jgi:hypothetical protein